MAYTPITEVLEGDTCQSRPYVVDQLENMAMLYWHRHGEWPTVEFLIQACGGMVWFVSRIHPTEEMAEEALDRCRRSHEGKGHV